MAVPLSVMQSAAQGDKKSMRLVEQEYGVGNGQNYAIDWLSEEEPPPRTSSQKSQHSDWEYRSKGAEQVYVGEAKALAEKISRLKKKSDIQDVLLKVAAEDAELAEQTARNLIEGGVAITAGSLAVGLAGPIAGPTGASALETLIGSGGGAVGASFGSLPISRAISENIRPSHHTWSKWKEGGKDEYESRERMQSIELSPEAQTIYDEYKAKGYSPTYYKTK